MTTSELPPELQPLTTIKPLRRTVLLARIKVTSISILIIAILAALGFSHHLSYFATASLGFLAVGATAIYVVWALSSIKKHRNEIIRHISSNNKDTVDVSGVFAMTTAILENTYIAFLSHELIILNAKTNSAVHALYADIQLVAHHYKKNQDEYVFYINNQAYAYRLVGSIDDIEQRYTALSQATSRAGANIIPALGAKLVYNKVNAVNTALEMRAQSALLGLLAAGAVTVETF